MEILKRIHLSPIYDVKHSVVNSKGYFLEHRVITSSQIDMYIESIIVRGKVVYKCPVKDGGCARILGKTIITTPNVVNETYFLNGKVWKF